MGFQREASSLLEKTSLKKVTIHLNRLPRAVVQLPFLERFNRHVVVAFGDIA